MCGCGRIKFDFQTFNLVVAGGIWVTQTNWRKMVEMNMHITCPKNHAYFCFENPIDTGNLFLFLEKRFWWARDF